ncbi:MAG: sporulation initiation factor Spo0A C-terminal domain-containing protein [Aristaeellaceae bacterium]
MPACLAITDSAQQGLDWQLALENLGPGWSCRVCAGAEDPLLLLTEEPVQLAVCGGQAGARALARLRERPPLAPPWLLAEQPCPWADAVISLARAEQLPEQLARWEQEGRLPVLALTRHGQMICLARGLLHAMTMPEHLRAWRFLPDMAALITVHPALMEDLHTRLYPLTARRHGMTPAAVERSLRLAIESTWSGASLGALERFFGHSVDPERGKPTNREFLCRVQERLTLAGRRMV